VGAELVVFGTERKRADPISRRAVGNWNILCLHFRNLKR
jgi:hypothetical protein